MPNAHPDGNFGAMKWLGHDEIRILICPILIYDATHMLIIRVGEHEILQDVDIVVEDGNHLFTKRGSICRILRDILKECRLEWEQAERALDNTRDGCSSDGETH